MMSEKQIVVVGRKLKGQEWVTQARTHTHTNALVYMYERKEKLRRGRACV
jgi:hypothetical protein